VLVTGEDLTLAVGTPGGDVQPQAVLQTLLNMRLFGMEPQQAVEAPRFATYSFPDSFEPHDYNAGVALLEAGLAGQAEELGRRGHQITLWPAATFRAGGVCVAMLDKRTGVLSGAADPRRPCYALGW
jgi:gamma-glutamyltranspeptidase/glutathione hydrolase